MYATPALRTSSTDRPPIDRALELDGPPGGPAEPDERLRELTLAVTLDPGDPEDLAAADLEVDAVQLPLTLETLHPQHRLTDLHLRLLQPEQDRATHHHLGQLGLGGLGRRRLTRPRRRVGAR